MYRWNHRITFVNWFRIIEDKNCDYYMNFFFFFTRTYYLHFIYRLIGCYVLNKATLSVFNWLYFPPPWPSQECPSLSQSLGGAFCSLQRCSDPWQPITRGLPGSPGAGDLSSSPSVHHGGPAQTGSHPGSTLCTKHTRYFLLSLSFHVTVFFFVFLFSPSLSLFKAVFTLCISFCRGWLLLEFSRVMSIWIKSALL